jgi:DNA mismatch endonuclease Vsr
VQGSCSSPVCPSSWGGNALHAAGWFPCRSTNPLRRVPGAASGEPCGWKKGKLRRPSRPEAPRLSVPLKWGCAFEAPMDTVTPAKRSQIMATVRGRNTAPELALRKAVHALGARYRVHAGDVPGRPDMVSRKARVAVFIDGCFWHGCPAHYRRPAANRGFWDAKLQRNRRRRFGGFA